jgi:hypothetical protein
VLRIDKGIIVEDRVTARPPAGLPRRQSWRT